MKLHDICTLIDNFEAHTTENYDNISADYAT